jgi:hypothetical protein
MKMIKHKFLIFLISILFINNIGFCSLIIKNNKQIQLLTNNQTWHDADEDFKDLIIGYAANEDGQYATIAQNILRVIDGLYYNYRIPYSYASSARINKNGTKINIKSGSKNSFNVIPNPNDGNFVIDFNSAGVQNYYEIIDYTGRILNKGALDINNSKNKVEANLKFGVYLLRVYSEEGSHYSKIIIQ